MKILYPTKATRNFYERNSVPSNLGYGNSGVAPHASQNRGTYTVPANRRAIVSSVYAQLIRITVAAPLGQAAAQVKATLNGSLFTVTEALVFTNTIGDKASQFTGSQIFMQANDHLDLYTYDLSTGGTFNYAFGCAILEFDA